MTEQYDIEKDSVSQFEKSILDATAEALLTVNLNGRVVYYNKLFVELWGIPDELLETKDDSMMLDFVMKKLVNPDEFIKTVKSLYDHPKQESKDIIQFKNGLYVERISKPQIVNNKIIGRVWSFRNITEQKLAERRIKENEERFRIIFDSSDIGIATLTDYFDDCNAKLCEIFECGKEEIIGRTPGEFSPENQPDGENSEKKSKFIIKAALKGIPQHFYWQHKTFKGRLVDTEVTIKRITINERYILQSIVRDITQFKRAEKIKDAIFKISESVNTTEDIDKLYERIHKIISELMPANNFYLALYDEEEDMISFPYFIDEYDPPQPPKKPGKGLTEYVLRTGKDILVDAETDEKLRASGEVELIGSPCPIWMGIALKLEGKTMGVMVLQDYENELAYGEEEKQILIFVSEQIAIAIDRKRKVENLKKLTEEYRQLNATKDKFFSIIAHDLKNPFNTLLGFSTMLNEEFDELDDEEKQQYIKFIKDASENTFELLQNLLEWSRSQTGRIEYNPENIDIKKLAENNVNLLNKNAELKGAELTTTINSICLAFADKAMVDTVLRNLITNAIKFTPSGGKITVSCRTNDKLQEVSVTDTGKGIDKESLDKLFKIDKTFTTEGTNGEKGTGLGLILCKEFIEKNHGKIWVESKPGKGSKFSFTLPRPVLK